MSVYTFGGDPKNDSYLDEKKIEMMIGILAADIRHDWSYGVADRLDAIMQLSKMLGRDDWVEEIKDNLVEIFYDGRWMRDEWSGPYSWEKCTRENVGDDLYDEYRDIISCLKSDSSEEAD